MTSKLCIFPFYAFLCIFLCFYVFYFFVVDKGVSLAPTYSSIVMKKSDLRSSLKSKRVMRGVDFRLLNGLFSPIKVTRDR